MILKRIRNSIIGFFIFLIFLEVALLIVCQFGTLPIHVPTYNFTNINSFWVDSNPHYGSQHPANSEIMLAKSCFSISMKSNSYGFRDKERKKSSSQKRVVVLGDSFVEGYGVEQQRRFTDLLEQRTGIPHLNFGISGNFGSTQYWQAYEHVASEFDHDAVIVCLLPANDFIDDDYEIGKLGLKERYRPYLIGEFPNYELIHYNNDALATTPQPLQEYSLKRFLGNFTYSYNVALYIKSSLLPRVSAFNSNEISLLPFEDKPSYFNFSAEHINRMKYALLKIKEKAGEKPIIVCSIPNGEELFAKSDLQNSHLGDELSVFCAENNMEYLNLLELQQQYNQPVQQQLFLSCDGHWSELGNSYTAKEIFQSFSFYSTQMNREVK
jgi:hypothetical protein